MWGLRGGVMSWVLLLGADSELSRYTTCFMIFLKNIYFIYLFRLSQVSAVTFGI